MSYVNAADVLPADMIKEIQKYVDGKVLYIPRKNSNAYSWGEKNGAKDRLKKRNKAIVEEYYAGKTIAELGSIYFLSEKRIQGIIREAESLNIRYGGFDNE